MECGTRSTGFGKRIQEVANGEITKTHTWKWDWLYSGRWLLLACSPVLRRKLLSGINWFIHDTCTIIINKIKSNEEERQLDECSMSARIGKDICLKTAVQECLNYGSFSVYLWISYLLISVDIECHSLTCSSTAWIMAEASSCWLGSVFCQSRVSSLIEQSSFVSNSSCKR